MEEEREKSAEEHDGKGPMQRSTKKGQPEYINHPQTQKSWVQKQAKQVLRM